VHEPPLLVTAAHVLDDRVRKGDVEGVVLEREVGPAGRHAADRRKLLGEVRQGHVAHGRDPLGPGIQRFEKIVAQRDTGLGVEAGVADADVDDGRLRLWAQLVQKECELAPAVPERHAGGETREHAQVIAAPR
jgi:hypothetical protein